jgi:type III secretory pathway component EscS
MFLYLLRKVKHFFLTILILLFIFFEELIWHTIVTPLYNYIKSLHLYEVFSNYIEKSANRYVVLVIFLIPFIAGEILGIISGLLIANLHIFAAILVYLLKIPLVFLALAILHSGHKKLNSFGWFAKSYTWTINKIDAIKQSRLYISAMKKIATMKNAIKVRKSKILLLMKRIYRKKKIQDKEI